MWGAHRDAGREAGAAAARRVSADERRYRPRLGTRLGENHDEPRHGASRAASWRRVRARAWECLVTADELPRGRCVRCRQAKRERADGAYCGPCEAAVAAEAEAREATRWRWTPATVLATATVALVIAATVALVWGPGAVATCAGVILTALLVASRARAGDEPT